MIGYQTLSMVELVTINCSQLYCVLFQCGFPSAYNLFYYLIVMKLNNNTQAKPSRDHLAISELMNTLKQINLNHSWKGSSIKINRTKTGLLNADTDQNRMTEQDVDKLFKKSNEKVKMRTEASRPQRQSRQIVKRNKDFTLIRFLQVEDQYDKFLTGFPPSNKENQHQVIKDPTDLTLKFKQNYIVGKVIGQGAYALVRVAIYKPQNKKIAIKAYEKGKIKQVPRKKTVRRQIKILQSLDHPNIVKILDVVQTNNHLNIIMEYLPGISLGVSLKQQPNQRFAQSSCKSIIRELAGVLRYLHERNIAHRDIKLENIILDDKLSPKLIDFGFSTCIDSNTKIKIFCGTPSYMAPEIVQKKEYRGQAADVWALGVMMYVMLVGYFPFKGSSDEELYKKINYADYPKQDIASYKQASHLLAKMFTIDPEGRITAEGILNHPWLAKSKQLLPERKTKNQIVQLRKLLSSSKERNPSAKHEDNSKKKRVYEMIYGKNLNRTKQSGTLISNTLNRTAKVQKQLRNNRIQEKSHSNKKLKVDPKLKILDLLKIELRKCSQQKSKCKSHRI